jgi:hypothetical protein
MQILILVINLEDKLTTAISNVHKTIYDKDILKLNTELNEEKVALLNRWPLDIGSI